MKTKQWKIKTTEIVHNGKTYRATDLQSIADLVEKLMFHPFKEERIISEYEVDTSLFNLEFCFPQKYTYNVSVALILTIDLNLTQILSQSLEKYNYSVWRSVEIEFKINETRADRIQSEECLHQLQSAITISLLLEHIKDQYDIVLISENEYTHIKARHKAQLVAERNKNE